MKLLRADDVLKGDITNQHQEDTMYTRQFFGWGMMMLVLVLCAVQSYSEPLPVERFVNATVEQTEWSLAMALTSRSPGLQTTAAQTIRELKQLIPEQSFSPVVIPLMRLVKDENGETASRILAALALHDLRSSMGDFAIARTAQFTESEQLKHICSWLAHYRLLESRQTTEEHISQLRRFLNEQQPEPLSEFVLAD